MLKTIFAFFAPPKTPSFPAVNAKLNAAKFDQEPQADDDLRQKVSLLCEAALLLPPAYRQNYHYGNFVISGSSILHHAEFAASKIECGHELASALCMIVQTKIKLNECTPRGIEPLLIAATTAHENYITETKKRYKTDPYLPHLSCSFAKGYIDIATAYQDAAPELLECWKKWGYETRAESERPPCFSDISYKQAKKMLALAIQHAKQEPRTHERLIVLLQIAALQTKNPYCNDDPLFLETLNNAEALINDLITEAHQIHMLTEILRLVPMTQTERVTRIFDHIMAISDRIEKPLDDYIEKDIDKATQLMDRVKPLLSTKAAI